MARWIWKWMDGWIDEGRWTKVWINRWMVDRWWMDRWIDWQMNGWMVAWPEWWIDKQTDGRMDGWVAGQPDWWRDRWINGQTDRQMNKWNNFVVFSRQEGQGTHIWILRQVEESQCFLSNQYTGSFVQGLRHGRGTFYHASGAIYEGEWHNNKSVSTVNQPGITSLPPH